MNDMKLVFEEDMGDVAICDICNRDYTGLPDKGGFVWNHRAVCPRCTIDTYYNLIISGQAGTVSHTCQPGETFQQMVVRYRAGNNMLRLYVAGGEESEP